jgi:flavin-dependent dehydrogenase
MDDKVKLQVGIVGAGIAGLSAAVALRRAGHDVEVRSALDILRFETDCEHRFMNGLSSSTR